MNYGKDINKHRWFHWDPKRVPFQTNRALENQETNSRKLQDIVSIWRQFVLGNFSYLNCLGLNAFCSKGKKLRSVLGKLWLWFLRPNSIQIVWKHEIKFSLECSNASVELSKISLTYFESKSILEIKWTLNILE